MDDHWEFAIICVIHIMIFELKMTVRGQHIKTNNTFFKSCHFLPWMFLFPEEDSDEIKIGTSCKNGGCTKVSKSSVF